jgi:hypothetical protein
LAHSILSDSAVYDELWVSLASLLRSYTAAHGLNGNRQATVELSVDRILVRHVEHWLDLRRDGATINWQREDGSNGTLELTADGRLHDQASPEADLEMDIAAEAWAQDLMRELAQ